MAWVSPTGFEDPSGEWLFETQAYDDDLGTNSYPSPSPTICSWCGFLVLTVAALACNKIRIYMSAAGMDTADVDVYKDGAWVDVYDGPVWDGEYKEIEFAEGSVSAMRFRTHGAGFVRIGPWVWEADFWQVAAPPAVVPRRKLIGVGR